MRLRAWLVVGLLGALTMAQAAVPEQARFGIVDGNDGLPSTEISGIAQDREGYLWLATGDGLARYDGADFKVWRHDPRDPHSLPGNSVQALYIDPDDRIWVSAEGHGVSVLDGARQQFVHYAGASYPQLLDEDVIVITGRGREVWFGTQAGQVYRVAGDSGLTRLDTAALLPADAHIMAMAGAPDGTLWIGTSAGLLRHDGRQLQREPMPAGDGVFSLAWIDDRLWVGGTDGVIQRDRAGQWHRPEWSRQFGTRAGNIVWSMAAASDGEYWLGSERGLWRTRRGAKAVPMLQGQVPLSGHRNVMALWRAADGGLWVPLHGRGLAYLRADWKRTAVVSLPATLGDGVYCPLVQARHGGLWEVAASGRLARLDTANGRSQWATRRYRTLRGMPVTAGVEDQQGRLWLGNYLNGLARLDLKRGHYWTWKRAADAPPQYGAPDTIVEQANGDIWLRVLNTLQRRDGRSGQVLDVFVHGRDSQLPGERPGQLGNGPDGEVWVAGKLGLRAWDPARRRFVAVPGIPCRAVDAFVLAADGALWTYHLGLLEEWRRAGTHWRPARRLSNAEGVPAIEAMDLRADMQSRLWLATRRGLWRIDPAAPRGLPVTRAFGPRDGLSSSEFIRGCLRMDRSGVLAGATVDGNLLLVDTLMPDAPATPPPLRVEEISVVRNGQRTALPIEGTIELRSTDRQLRVSARLLSYGDAQGIGYRWRMLGLDENWSERDALAQREFAGLPPGEYRLQIQGVDALGNVSNVHHLHLIMPPPWWRSGPGLLLIAVLAILVVWAGAALYRQRLRTRHAWQLAQHKRELAEQASLAKSHFLATLGHEVRTPMTGVLGMAELLLQTPLDRRQHGYASAIDTAGRHLLRLVNDALDLARIEAGKLSLERHDFSVAVLVRQVVALAQPLAERKGLSFRCDVDGAMPVALRGDASRLQQILLNLLSNAIKFTDRGEVSLHVTPAAKDHGVVFVVADSGPGLSAEQQARLFRRFEQGGSVPGRARRGGSGLGLAICRELATAMGGQIGVDSAPGLGARFRLELPLPSAGTGEQLPQAPPAAAPALPALRVLLVEDDDMVAEVVAGLLAARGHQVTRVAHGLAALAELQIQDFDVGLFDLDLPGIDGLALVRQLRAMGHRLPVIALTARSDAAAEPQARAVGCAGFLRKPATGDALARTLAALRLPAEAEAPA